MNKRSHLHKKADSSTSNPVRSQFQSRPFIAQAKPKSDKPLTQTETENQEFQQQKFEATKLNLQAKYGTITPEGQERLTVLQAKMSGLLHRRLEQALSKGSNFANIPISRPDAPSQQAIQETPTPVQAKLTIGEPGDKYEREADAIANKVMSMSVVAPLQMGTPEKTHSQVRSQPLAAKITPLVQHKAMPQSDRPLQGADEVESLLRRSKGGGSPLPKNVQAYMAPRLGADLSDRRVHTGKEAVQMNQEIGALAFTHGKDIYYGAGQSPRNDHLTAHEVAHTFQQTGSAVQKKEVEEQRRKDIHEKTGESSYEVIQRFDQEEATEQEAHQEPQNNPPEAAKVIEQFNKGGLLIRTLNKTHAAKEFENLQETVEEALERGKKTGGHSGLRKWSLIQKDLLANYYKMGPEVLTMARYMAILADPSEIGDRYIGIHEKDAFSGNLLEGTKLKKSEEAMKQIEQLLDTLKQKQLADTKPLENNEIQTLGFNAKAVVGLLYKASGGNGPKEWRGAREEFQRLVNEKMGEEESDRFPVFTYEIEEKQTKLIYLETLSKEDQATAPR